MASPSSSSFYTCISMDLAGTLALVVRSCQGACRVKQLDLHCYSHLQVDGYSAKVMRLNIATAAVTAFAGSVVGGRAVDGVGTNAVFDIPYCVALAPNEQFALVVSVRSCLMAHALIHTRIAIVSICRLSWPTRFGKSACPRALRSLRLSLQAKLPRLHGRLVSRRRDLRLSPGREQSAALLLRLRL